MKNNILKYLLIVFLFFVCCSSYSQIKTTVQTFDSQKVCDGYIMRWGNKHCQLMDREGNTLFNFPGSLISFFNNKREIASSLGTLVFYNKDLDILRKININIHHELKITPEDNILLLSYKVDTINHLNVNFDVIACFDSTGKELYQWSTFDQRGYLLNYIMKDTAIFRYKIRGLSDPDSILFRMAPGLNKAKMEPGINNREFFHMNAIQVIPENKSGKENPVFRKGNILLCFCNYSDSLASFIAVVDPVNFKILWHYVQKDRKPMHTPAILPNGHLLIYINSTLKGDSSFIEEINPLTKEVVWQYTETFPRVIMRHGIGSCQRLPNGNTLISNSNGYIYEVTPDKKTVWQWHSEDENRPVYRAYYYSKEELSWLVDDE